MTSIGKAAREKGIAFEQYLVKRFRLAGFIAAKRHMEFQEAEAEGYDLDNVGPFRVQAKRYEHYVPISTIFDIVCPPGAVPVLVTKPDKGPAIACLPLEDFLRLVRSAQSKDLASPHDRDFL
jgi:hypothetical protein